MNLLNKLERKFGRYAIPNLMRYIVAVFVIGLLIGSFLPYIYVVYFPLDFSMVMKGQVWRLLTFIIPASSMNGIFFTALSVYIYYWIGNTVEQQWGAFRMNLFFLTGILLNILASLITYLATGTGFLYPSTLDLICGTLMFAFAAIYPNASFYIYFLIPIKAKYWALIIGATYVYRVYEMIMSQEYLQIVPIVATFVNLFIFILATRNSHRISPSEMRRKANYRRQMNEARNHGNVTEFRGRNVITRHKCAVCGRTELDGDQLEFRFCSKCEGNYEYCMDHLFTHEHVKSE